MKTEETIKHLQEKQENLPLIPLETRQMISFHSHLCQMMQTVLCISKNNILITILNMNTNNGYINCENVRCENFR